MSSFMRHFHFPLNDTIYTICTLIFRLSFAAAGLVRAFPSFPLPSVLTRQLQSSLHYARSAHVLSGQDREGGTRLWK